VAGGTLAGTAGCLLASPDTSGLPGTEESGGGESGAVSTTDATPATTGTAGETTTRTAGETTTGTAGETTTGTAGETTTARETTAEPALRESVTVVVGEDGAFYDPREFRLAVGGTVEWVWSGNGHNVVVDDRPADSDWSGTAGADSRLYDAGHTHAHTFEVAGEYAYHCYDHRAYGMVGSFTVE